MLKYLFALNLLLYSGTAEAGDRAKNAWVSLGSEFSSYSLSYAVGGATAQRSGNSLLNFGINVSQRLHSDFWFGISGFVGHDSSPEVGRNYDQNLGVSLHWFPLTLSSDSGLTYEGLELTERAIYRPFVLTQVLFGRALLRRGLNDFEASSDYLGFGLGAGSQYSITPAFSLAATLSYQKNFAVGQLAYDGQKIAAGLSAVLLY